MDWFFLGINPEPWTIGTAGVNRTGGKLSAYISPDPQMANYKKALREEFRLNYNAIEVIEEPLGLEFFFYRRLDEYQTETGRASQRHIADATNLQKATEDAFQGLIYRNDRQVIDVHSQIVEQSTTTTGCVIIRVKRIHMPTHVIGVEALIPMWIHGKHYELSKKMSGEPNLDNSW